MLWNTCMEVLKEGKDQQDNTTQHKGSQFVVCTEWMFVMYMCLCLCSPQQGGACWGGAAPTQVQCVVAGLTGLTRGDNWTLYAGGLILPLHLPPPRGQVTPASPLFTLFITNLLIVITASLSPWDECVQVCESLCLYSPSRLHVTKAPRQL